MADTQKLRDLAASYRLRCSEGESDLVARYNLDMARYLDSIVATVEAADARAGYGTSSQLQSEAPRCANVTPSDARS